MAAEIDLSRQRPAEYVLASKVAPVSTQDAPQGVEGGKTSANAA